MILDTQQLMRIKPCLYYNQLYNDTFTMNIHKHNTLEIMYVHSGLMTVEYISANCKKEYADVVQGQFVMIKPNLAHKILFPQKSDSNVLNIEFESRDPLFKIDNVFFLNSITKAFPQAAELNKSFETLLVFNDTSNFLQSLLNLHEVLGFELSGQQFETVYTFNLGRLITAALLCESVYARYNGGNIYINKAVMFMQKNLHEDIALDEIAKATGCSAVYLEKLFKKHYGKTVSKKLNELRVARAKHMLKHFNLPIKEIGLHIGFKNTQSFINNFKSVTGLTPNEYRNKKQLEYKHIRAYEQSYLDEKFDNFLTFDKGVMEIGCKLNDFMNKAYLNAYLYDGSEDITDLLFTAVKETHKFIFADADAFEYDGEKLKAFIDKITDLQLFDNLVGFYVKGSPETIAEKIRFVYGILPLKRILADADGQIPPADIMFKVTDVLLDEENYNKVGGSENVILWLKKNAAPVPNDTSFSQRYLKFNFGGIVYDNTKAEKTF